MDVNKLLIDVSDILTDDGMVYFTSLIRGDRIADRYLKIWENAGEVVSRDSEQLHVFFNDLEMPIKCDVNGNMAFIQYGRMRN